MELRLPSLLPHTTDGLWAPNGLLRINGRRRVCGARGLGVAAARTGLSSCADRPVPLDLIAATCRDSPEDMCTDMSGVVWLAKP